MITLPRYRLVGEPGTDPPRGRDRPVARPLLRPGSRNDIPRLDPIVSRKGMNDAQHNNAHNDVRLQRRDEYAHPGWCRQSERRATDAPSGYSLGSLRKTLGHTLIVEYGYRVSARGSTHASNRPCMNPPLPSRASSSSRKKRTSGRTPTSPAERGGPRRTGRLVAPRLFPRFRRGAEASSSRARRESLRGASGPIALPVRNLRDGDALFVRRRLSLHLGHVLERERDVGRRAVDLRGSDEPDLRRRAERRARGGRGRRLGALRGERWRRRNGTHGNMRSRRSYVFVGPFVHPDRDGERRRIEREFRFRWRLERHPGLCRRIERDRGSGRRSRRQTVERRRRRLGANTIGAELDHAHRLDRNGRRRQRRRRARGGHARERGTASRLGWRASPHGLERIVDERRFGHLFGNLSERFDIDEHRNGVVHTGGGSRWDGRALVVALVAHRPG